MAPQTLHGYGHISCTYVNVAPHRIFTLVHSSFGAFSLNQAGSFFFHTFLHFHVPYTERFYITGWAQKEKPRRGTITMAGAAIFDTLVASAHTTCQHKNTGNIMDTYECPPIMTTCCPGSKAYQEF